MKAIRNCGKKKISLDEIARVYKLVEYNKLVDFIFQYIEKGDIEPIISSGTNGKTPALYNRYWVNYEDLDKSKYESELLYKIHTSLKVDYYLNNLDKYIGDREYILKLSKYLSYNGKSLNESMSLNERSFDIWAREKYLKEEGGIKVLKNLGLSLVDLNIYETTEPLSYYSHHKNTPQNILILENKDTFYSLRRHLINKNNTILGLPIGTLIYGKGKGIIKSFRDFTFCVEPYLEEKSNKILYFGDLDYEGILIFEQLSKAFKKNIPIKPFIEAYIHMLKKADQNNLPNMKLGQNKNIGNVFLNFFDDKEKADILHILGNNKYIPQEIMNKSDF